MKQKKAWIKKVLTPVVALRTGGEAPPFGSNQVLAPVVALRTGGEAPPFGSNVLQY